MSMVMVDSDMIIRQVSLGQNWCLILSLVSVWSSSLYDMYVCPLLTSATAVLRISCWFLIVHLVKMLYTCHRYSKQREWDGWAHKPGLTHLSLVPVPGPLWYSICIINSYNTLLNWPIVSLLILFVLFSNVLYFCTWLYSVLYWLSLFHC